MQNLVARGTWRHAGFVVDEETMDEWIELMGTNYSHLEEHQKNPCRKQAQKTLDTLHFKDNK
jgi:hypothetical protein